MAIFNSYVKLPEGIPPSSSPVRLNPMNSCQEVTFPLTQSLRWTSARCGEVGLGSPPWAYVGIKYI